MASSTPFSPHQTTSYTSCKNPTTTAAVTKAVATTAAGATTRSRQQLVRAQQLFLSRNLHGARRAYALALNESQFLGSFDLPACFLCHVRLAQLSLIQTTTTAVDGNPTTVAQGHLESAWSLRDHLIPPLTGALGCYFRGVGLKLAGLYDENGDTKKGADVRRCLEGLRLSANESSQEGGACGGEELPFAAAKTAAAARSGRGGEAETDVDCNGCGRAAKDGTAAKESRDPAKGWYCLDCTCAYDKAADQVGINLRVFFIRLSACYSTPSRVPSVSLSGLPCQHRSPLPLPPPTSLPLRVRQAAVPRARVAKTGRSP